MKVIMSIESGSKFIPETEEGEAKIMDEHEHVVDIESPEVKAEIEAAKELFERFYEQHVTEFDLTDEGKIEDVYAAAEKEGIFQKAREIRELIFDKNVSIYGVCYLSNKCGSNHCAFCPMGQMCRKMWMQEEKEKENLGEARQQLEYWDSVAESKRQRGAIRYWRRKIKSVVGGIAKMRKKIKALTPFQAAKDMDALTKIGHQEICVLAGEELAPDITTRVAKSANDPYEIAKYVQIALNRPGVKEVILNIGAFSENVFRVILENLKIPNGVKLQFRVFQESYDPEEYDYYLRYADEDCHNKRDWQFRYDSQVAALKAGFDDVGVGALFGLTRYPLREIFGLQKHAEYIKEKGGKEPKRCCLPIANDPESPEWRYEGRIQTEDDFYNVALWRRKAPEDVNVSRGHVSIRDKKFAVDVKYMIPRLRNQEKITELIYALARLAMPTVSIVSSERDNPKTLEGLDRYANHCTLDVHPYPGGNIDALQELEKPKTGEEAEKPVGQAEVFPRDPAKAIKSWQERGYKILGFNCGKYI